jgi:hypothetical protein
MSLGLQDSVTYSDFSVEAGLTPDNVSIELSITIFEYLVLLVTLTWSLESLLGELGGALGRWLRTDFLIILK